MKIRWLFLFTVVSLCTVFSFGSDLADPRYDREMSSGIDLIMRLEYDSASQLFSKMIQKDRNYPAGYFMQATLIVARFYDKNDTASLHELYQMIDKILTMTEGRKEPIYVFYRGAAYSYLSVFQVKDGRWVSGARSGKKAADIFKRMTDDKIVSGDVLGMLGSYHYWSSAVLKKLAWLPFIQDRREQGIREMVAGLRRSKYLRFGLLNSILWVYYDNGRYLEALNLCRQVMKDYPRHPIFTMIEMNILYKLKDYSSALREVTQLLRIYDKYEAVPVNLIAIKIKMALIYYSMGRKKEADVIVESLASAQRDPYLKKRLERDFSILQKSRY